MSFPSGPSAPAAAETGGPGPEPAELDRSCRGPVLTLWVGALGWLLLGSALALLASIKLHAPGFLADLACLTYGRVHPAAEIAWTFGFASQAGAGLVLWLTCRLSAAPLRGRWLVATGAAGWNLGVFLGLGGVLAGEGAGLPGLELPGYAALTLLVSFLGIALGGALTFHARRRAQVYVAEWFAFGALLAFPWILSAGHILGVAVALRGVLQAAVQAWSVQNLHVLWLGFLGLAAVFYLLPKLLGAPVPSRSLAIFGFWTLALFGSLAGLRRYWGGPFPSWMLSVSVVAGVGMIVPLLAVALNLLGLCHRQGARLWREVPLRFAAFALGSFLLAGLLEVGNSWSWVRRTTHFSLFSPALEQWWLQGFVGMALLGVLYFVVPRLMGRDWPWPILARAHFGLAGAGVLLLVGGGLAGGIVHGRAMNDPTLPFFLVARRWVPFAGMATLGWLLLGAGHLALGLNLAALLSRRARELWAPVADYLRSSPVPAEVKA